MWDPDREAAVIDPQRAGAADRDRANASSAAADCAYFVGDLAAPSDRQLAGANAHREFSGVRPRRAGPCDYHRAVGAGIHSDCPSVPSIFN